MKIGRDKDPMVGIGKGKSTIKRLGNGNYAVMKTFDAGVFKTEKEAKNAGGDAGVRQLPNGNWSSMKYIQQGTYKTEEEAKNNL
jgi:hypothetical protein